MAKQPPKQGRRTRQQKIKTAAKRATTKPAATEAEAAPELHLLKIPSVWQLSRQAIQVLVDKRGLFIGIVVWYGLLNVVLVRGLSNVVDIASLKAEFSTIAHGSAGRLAGGALTFTQLLGTAGSGSTAAASAYQLFLFLIISLALIWALRQSHAGATVRIRDAYYRGMYPLVQFSLVLLVIGLELLPLIIGVALYELVISSNIAVNGLEQAIWGAIAIVLAFVSLYLIASSIIALYIVTLPDMTPLKALRSARDLTRHRRWTVARKMLFLPLILILLAAVITVPFILFAAVIAPWVFFILTLLAMAIAHSYLYSLYRGLLHD